MSNGSAFRAAWAAYLVLLVLPFVALGIVVVLQEKAVMPPRPLANAQGWLLVMLAYFAVAIPAALFCRRRLCGAYFRGAVVTPRRYLLGMLAVWMALEIAMILPIVGSYVTASFMPGLLLALVAFAVFITQLPTGSMMTSGLGSSDDAEFFEEPR